MKQKHNSGPALTMFFCKLPHWISSLEDVVSNNPLHKIHLLAFFGIKPKFTYDLAMIATFQSWLIWPCIDRGLLRSSKIHQFRSPGPPSSPTDFVLRLWNNAEFRFVISKSWFSHNLTVADKDVIWLLSSPRRPILTHLYHI